MQLSIIEAGKLIGVHRATLHRWLKTGQIQKEKNGLIETDRILEQMGKRRKGRPAGWAYTKARLSKVGDYGVTLERSVVVLAGIIKTLSADQQKWVKETILQRIDDPKLLKAVEESIETSQEAIVETDREKLWNDILLRGTVKPKRNIHSPVLQALGEELKRRELEEQAGLPIRRAMPPAPAPVVAPHKRPADPTQIAA